MICRYDPYEWHRRRLAGEVLPIHEIWPEAGWYMTSVTGGQKPFLPSSIFWAGPRGENGELIADETTHCEIADVPRDKFVEWQWMAIRPVTYEEYLYWKTELFSGRPYLGPQRTRVRWITDKEVMNVHA